MLSQLTSVMEGWETFSSATNVRMTLPLNMVGRHTLDFVKARPLHSELKFQTETVNVCQQMKNEMEAQNVWYQM